MILTIIISILTCLLMILSVLFFPTIKINKLKIDTYWIIVLFGAILSIVTKRIDIKFLFNNLTDWSTSVNPIKILLLFISMTILSIFLDEVGFFKYLANQTLKSSKKGQTVLFICLYWIVSLLTIFTSNDIIVLTFTPFICYFCRNAKINPIPYLVSEFVAANTMSMMFIIGNPTNIYIASTYSITFFEYLKVMFIPTLASGVVAFLVLYLIFKKELKKEIEINIDEIHIKNKTFLIIGLAILSICTILLAIGSYIGIDMWLVSVASACLLFILILIICLIKKEKPIELKECIKRAPWQLIPFVLSMFVIILSLQQQGVTSILTNALGEKDLIFRYGISSFLSANIINNIPMSVLYCQIISPLTGSVQCYYQQAIYSSIVGSNIGAFLTPIGALAGIMWSSLIKEYDVKYTYVDFIKYGVIISIPTLLTTLLLLNIIL